MALDCRRKEQLEGNLNKRKKNTRLKNGNIRTNPWDWHEEQKCKLIPKALLLIFGQLGSRC